VTYTEQTNITKRCNFAGEIVLEDMCRIGRWSFWFRFDVYRSIFDEDMHDKTIITYSFLSDLDLDF